MSAARIALVASVALNLLVAGVLLGSWLDREPHRDARLRGAGPMAPFAAAMPTDDRRALLADLRQGRAEGPRPGNSSERFDALLDAIRAEPFDRAQLQGLLAAERTSAVARQESGERLLVDRIAGMTAAERSAYAGRLEGAFSRPHRH